MWPCLLEWDEKSQSQESVNGSLVLQSFRASHASGERTPVIVRRNGRQIPCRGRVGIAEFVRGQQVDRARLRCALLVGKSAAFDLEGQRLFGFIDRICSKQSQAAMDDCSVVFRRSRKALVGCNAWQIARDMHLREMSVRRKNNHALWFIAKRQALAAIGRRDFGDHEVPGSDKLLL